METVAIHSVNVAQQIIDSGHPLIKFEINRRQPGKLIFIFERNNVVIDVLERNKRKQ